MAKRKPLFGVSNYTKRTPKKRPGVHTKNMNKRKPHRKKYRGQGRQFRTILRYAMKFLLVISICSQIHLECLPPMVHDMHFNTHYECAMKGYKIAKDMMSDLGRDHVNQDGIVIAFKCKVGSEVQCSSGQNAQRANKRCEKRSSFYTKKILLTSLDLILYIPISNENNKQKKGEIVLWLIQQNTNLCL